MLRSYFENEKASLLERMEQTEKELGILDAAMREVLLSDAPETEKVELAQYINGGQERDRSRMKILSERLEIVSRLLRLVNRI